MAPDVERTIVDSYMHIYQTQREEATEWLQSLEENGRYAKDVWAGALIRKAAILKGIAAFFMKIRNHG